MLDRDLIQAIAELESPDSVFELLSKPRARYTLRWLLDEPSSDLETLADGVAGQEAAASESIVSAADRDRIRTALYHFILPELDELGYVTFDFDTCTVEETDIPAAVRSLLRHSESCEDCDDTVTG